MKLSGPMVPCCPWRNSPTISWTALGPEHPAPMPRLHFWKRCAARPPTKTTSPSSRSVFPRQVECEICAGSTARVLGGWVLRLQDEHPVVIGSRRRLAAPETGVISAHFSQLLPLPAHGIKMRRGPRGARTEMAHNDRLAARHPDDSHHAGDTGSLGAVEFTLADDLVPRRIAIARDRPGLRPC